MKNSFHSLLYPTMFGHLIPQEDLILIGKLKNRSSQDIFSQLTKEFQNTLTRFSWESRWDKVIEQIKPQNIRFTSIYCEDYPKTFFELQKPPPLISYMGNPVWMNKPVISVVGSRKPLTESLRWMSHHLPTTLKGAQVGVVSGGARGVDQWAHRLSILAGQPTICLIPAGLSEIYPDSLMDLIPQIISTGGAVVSAYGLDVKMRKYFFHERNQLIAVMGRCCLIIEAGRKSGSLVTAKEAGEMGRDVLALPFSPWCGAGSGSNYLIKEGAAIVTEGEEILDQIFKSRWP